MKRVFAIDVLVCPHCSGTRKLIALLTDGLVAAIVGMKRRLGLHGNVVAWSPHTHQRAHRSPTGRTTGRPTAMEIIGLDLHKRESQLSIRTEDGTITERRLEKPSVRKWYAWMLLRRDAPSDRDHARVLLDEAIASFRAMGMTLSLGETSAMRESLDG